MKCMIEKGCCSDCDGGAVVGGGGGGGAAASCGGRAAGGGIAAGAGGCHGVSAARLAYTLARLSWWFTDPSVRLCCTCSGGKMRPS